MAAAATAIKPTCWGLAAKLFAVLILLGAVAVLITGILGYVRARDSLEQTIFNQLRRLARARRRAHGAHGDPAWSSSPANTRLNTRSR